MKLENKKSYKKFLSSGFTLIEVMAAVAVLSIGLIGGLTTITNNLKNISAIDNRIIAANLAAEGIELVRNVRDTNWLLGKTDNNGADAWDTGIDGIGSGSDKAIQFFCGGIARQYLNETNIDNPPCSGAGGYCQIYIYTKTADNSKCYSDDFNNQAGYSRVATNFYRLIRLERLNIPSLNPMKPIKVTVYVKTVAGAQSNTITASETLYNWK